MDLRQLSLFLGIQYYLALERKKEETRTPVAKPSLIQWKCIVPICFVIAAAVVTTSAITNQHRAH